MSFQILRRNFLKGLGAITAANTLPGLSLMNAYAQAASDYKALVCVFLYGGNDANNMVVPVQAAEYNDYATGRGTIALPQGSLVPLAQATGTRFGLHANLAPLQQVWTNGDLALLFNTGPLVQPLTRTQYLANRTARPRTCSRTTTSRSRTSRRSRAVRRLSPRASGGAGGLATACRCSTPAQRCR